LETLSTNNLPRREAATMAIKAMNTPPRQILNALIEFSTNSSPRLRQNSLEALQGLRSNHPSAIANYFKATADFDAGVRTAAAHALGQANNWNTNPALGNVVAHLLKRESSSLRSNAVETLTGLLSDSAMPVREAAQQSLAALQSSSAN
jgi:HEAT repeat protein